MQTLNSSRRDCLRWFGAAAAASLAGAPLVSSAATLERIRERGTLTVAVYQDMPPFHVPGKGIDVEIAQALAESLGVKLSLLPFAADESMSGDLRNMGGAVTTWATGRPTCCCTCRRDRKSVV